MSLQQLPIPLLQSWKSDQQVAEACWQAPVKMCREEIDEKTWERDKSGERVKLTFTRS